MAKTNTTVRTTTRAGDDYSIISVNARARSSINDASLDANNEMILAGDDAANQPIRFTVFVTISGNPNAALLAIQNFKRGTSHYQNGLEFLFGCDISNVTIVSAGPVRCSASPTTVVRLRNVGFLMLPNAGTSAQRNNTLFYFRNCALDLDGVVVDGGSCALDAAKFVRFDNYSPRNMAEGFMTVTGRGTDAPHFLRLNGFNPVGCTKDFAFLTSSKYVFYGYPDKIPTGSVHFDHDRVTEVSSATLRKELFLSLLDSETKAPILGALSELAIFAHDRTTYADAQFTLDAGGRRLTHRSKYDVIATPQGILEYDFPLAYLAVGAGENVGRGSAPRPVIYFTKNDSKEYAHDIELKAYGYQTKFLPDFDLKGLDPITKTEFMQQDANITERDKSLVAAYTTIANLDELYDALSMLDSNTMIEPGNNYIEGTTLVMAGGQNVSLLARSAGTDAVIDASMLVTIFLPAGLTLAAGERIKSLEVQRGTVSFEAGTSISAPYFDQTFDSVGTIILGGSLDGVTVHRTAADADSGTNAISTGTTFRYLASEYAGTTLFLRGTNSNAPDDEVILAQVIPPGTGNHVLGNLGFGEDAQLRAIQAIALTLESQNTGITTLGNNLVAQNTGIAGLGNTLQTQNVGIAALGEYLRTQNTVNLAAIQNNANKISEGQFTQVSVIYSDRNVSDHSTPNSVIATVSGNGNDLDITRTGGSDTDNILVHYSIPADQNLTLGDGQNEFNEFVVRLYNKSDTTQNLSITAVFQSISGAQVTEVGRQTTGVTLIENSVNNENALFEFHNIENSNDIERVVLLFRGLEQNKTISISSYGAYRRTIKQSAEGVPTTTPTLAGFSAQERDFILKTLGQLEADEVETLLPIEVFKVIPSYSINGPGFTKTQRNSNIYIRGDGSLHDNAVTLTRPTSITLGGASTDADEYVVLIRNTGGNDETLNFQVQLIGAGTIRATDTVDSIEFPGQGDLQEVKFKFHNNDSETTIDEIRWVITGLVGGVAIEAEGFYKRELKTEAGAVSIDQDALVRAIIDSTEFQANVLLTTTIAQVIDQTHFVLAAGATFNGYANQIIKVSSMAVAENQSYVAIGSYDNISKTLILKEPLEFVAVAGDKVNILIRDTGRLAVTLGLNDDSNIG